MKTLTKFESLNVGVGTIYFIYLYVGTMTDSVIHFCVLSNKKKYDNTATS